ncbi:Sel1 repeat-containing protein [Succinivibrio dextrinosolvens]|uniref:tetratricopeptide repeat protein n=1 Tax=Succinivibrio dextrinosolvens TaxID=83771 RepID=UPI0008E2486F|nr:tetratricopeptide repeat protein [Succinivibrio dextrinosolvens]SFS48134.1 Sel1 repeat-containing protein [Succinivibrio dextrinosolvens]
MKKIFCKALSMVLCALSFIAAAEDSDHQELPIAQCNLKSSAACEYIGMYYTNVVGDDAKALPFFQKGCELNSKESCTFCGNIFAEGLVVGKDFERALNYYEKGCELKDGIACNLLGSFYENGENVDKDLKKALYYYNRACNEGDWAQSCETLKEISEK